MTLFSTEDILPPSTVTAMTRTELITHADQASRALAALVNEDHQELLMRILKLVNLPRLSMADDHDLREINRELRLCLEKGGYKSRLRRRTHVDRPAGIGRLPRPRWVKEATADGSCGLCGDSYSCGDEIGRAYRDPKVPHYYAQPGWLCWHCLVMRRQQPTRRDLLLRFFHGLFAQDGIGLNGHECGVLLRWLNVDPVLRTSKPWADDPLESTLARLETSVAEDKPVTWLSPQTVLTIIAVLQEPGSAVTLLEPEDQVLTTVTQHLAEWETNSSNVTSLYGTGWRYRQRTLELTATPTVLSRAGGPFHLFQCKVTATGRLQDPDKP
ncbi:hypothetical protein ACWCWD_29360 [Streptomyces sp. NPDC001493]